MAVTVVCVLVFLALNSASGELCPKQCDCDMNSDGRNRAVCVNQNIISIDVGVPKQVQVYSLSNNVISELDNYCFKEAGYTSILILNLSYNLIFWIGIHAFSGLDELVSLDLSNNRLRYIPSDLFWDTAQLESLDLSGNVFESLKNEPFIMHTKLQILNLNNCRIKSLPNRLFTRLPNLRKLDLSENYMISITTDLLKPMSKLKRIELGNEYWECTPELIAVETWISSHGITYEKQCRKKLHKMSEKMISVTPVERQAVDINKVWNVTRAINMTSPVTEPTNKLTPFQKFDKEFPSSQAFIIGLEVGLGLGIVGTYLWLRNLCKCTRIRCRQVETRRQLRRAQRVRDNDMRANLLWSNIVNPDLETPPSLRRELSLPEHVPSFPAYGLPGMAEHTGPVSVYQFSDRAETPPPPYNDCRINI